MSISFEVTRKQFMVAQQGPTVPVDLVSYFETARTWLHEAAGDLLVETHSPIVPAISPAFTYRPRTRQNSPYLPSTLWNVRCLSPQERHELYHEFCMYGRIMQMNGWGSSEYKCAFDLVVEKSRDIAQKERQWYAQFISPQGEPNEQKIKALRAVVAQQAQAVDLRAVSSSSQPGNSAKTAIVVADGEDDYQIKFQDQKRYASNLYTESNPQPAKRVTPDVDEKIREERAAKAEADHQRYLQQKQMIDEHYLRGGRSRKSTDPEWQKLAVFDADQVAQRTMLSTKKRRQPSPRQTKRSHADEVACPELPSRGLASYPMKAEGTYMCLHVDVACGGKEDCTSRNHDCCRKGLSLGELEHAVRRKEERVCARIEELAFREGKLDRRHKTWEDWFSKKMRDGDSSRKKARVPALGWTHDVRAWQVE